MQAIVLAGGLGTRLRSRVASLPKPMAPVGGRPFLAYLLDRLEAAGCTDVLLATGYLADTIEAHFGSRYGGIAVDYAREDTPLGTGGAIRNALSRVQPRPTLVVNGDTWVGVDLRAFDRWCTERNQCNGMVLRRVDDGSRFGRVTLEGERVVAFEAEPRPGPALVNAGIYRLKPDAFDGLELPPAFSIENDFFRPFARRLDLHGYPTSERFIDIGVPEDFDRAQTELPRWAAERSTR